MNFADLQKTEPHFIDSLKADPAGPDWYTCYHTYAPAIYSLACKSGLKDTAAQEIVQATMIAIFTSLPGFSYNPNQGKFRNWIYGIARYRILQHFRKASQEARRPEDSIDSPQFPGGPSLLENIQDSSQVSPDEAMHRQWILSLCETQVQMLLNGPKVSENQKAIFEALVLDDQSPELVAQKQGVSVSVVYTTKHRMLSYLQKNLRRWSSELELDGQE